MTRINNGKELIDLINESNVNVFADFYTLYFRKLLLASDKYVKDIFVAEEIVQNVFLKIWEAPQSLEEVKSVKSYLYRSVINASINHVNRQKNIAQHHLKMAADLSEANLLQMDDDNDLILTLYAEIEKLPAQCKKVFKMSRFEHLKYKEIAAQLNISERTVENHVGAALRILRESMLKKVGHPKSDSIQLKIILNFLLFH